MKAASEEKESRKEKEKVQERIFVQGSIPRLTQRCLLTLSDSLNIRESSFLNAQ